MIHISAKKKKSVPSVEDLLIVEPIHKRILSFSTLTKISILAVIAILAYFLVTFVIKYETSIYFPILIILLIIVFFILWVTCLYLLFSITSTQLESKLIKKLFSLLLVMGVLSAYFAVVIENKSFTLVSIISGFFSSIDSFPEVYHIVHYIFYVFVIPIVEEIAKIFPIIILLGNYVRLNLNSKRSIHTRLTPSFRIFVIVGGFFGAWFDLFEQFLSYSRSSSPETVIDLLVLKRCIYPLHTVTTMLAATGLGLAFLYRNKLPKFTRAIVVILFLALSIFIHSLWNYNTKFNTNVETVSLIYSILGILSYALFGIFILVVIFYVPSFCPKCFTQHIGKECSDTSSQLHHSKENLEKMKEIEPLYDEKTNLMVCSQCRTPVYNGQFCLNCWSFPKIQCRNCNQVLPSFTRICWSCGTEVDALYEKMSSSSPPFYSSIAVGFTRILAVGMLISFIFTFATIEDTVSFLGYTLFLLSIIIAIFVTVVWHRYKKNRVKAIISSINLLSIVAISIIVTSLYMIVFSLLLIITILHMVYGIIGMLCTLVLVSASVYFLLKTSKGVRLVIL